MPKAKKERYVIRRYSQLGCDIVSIPKEKKRRKMTNDLAEEIRLDFNMAYNFSGTKYHVSQEFGEIIFVNKLEIYDLRTKNIIAMVKRPMEFKERG